MSVNPTYSDEIAAVLKQRGKFAEFRLRRLQLEADEDFGPGWPAYVQACVEFDVVNLLPPARRPDGVQKHLECPTCESRLTLRRGELVQARYEDPEDSEAEE
jgi:hypothetical protein